LPPIERFGRDDWETLKARLAAKRIRVVTLDLPTSWSAAAPADEATAGLIDAINRMLLDGLNRGPCSRPGCRCDESFGAIHVP
jgi:hypothetical protein